jgi:hypothetical protein
MDMLEGPTLALALAGFIISLFAVIISWQSLDTNKAMADAAEESARTAREAVELQRRAERKAKKACLHLARDMADSGISYYTSRIDGVPDSLRVGIELFLRNEGLSAAFNCELDLFTDTAMTHKLGGEQAVRTCLDERVEPDWIQKVGVVFPPEHLTAGADMAITARVTFEDRIGRDELIVSFVLSESPRDPQWREIQSPKEHVASELCRPD